jgi:GT2 family glycosyltransferase/glycosyltransferase involved in cell wall biosynthesis
MLGLSLENPRRPEQLLTRPPASEQPCEQDQPSTTQASAQTDTDESALGDVAEQIAQSKQEQQQLQEQQERHEQFGPYHSLTLLASPREAEIAAILEERPAAGALRRADVICFSIIDWEFRYQRPQQIMSQFAANGHRVFYVSTTRFQSPASTPRVLVSKIKDNVYEVQLAADRPLDVYGEVIDSNSDALLGSLEELRRTFHIDEAVAYVMIASWGNVALEAGRLWNWRVVYDCMDEWENFPGIQRVLVEMEAKLVASCDLLVVTGRRLHAKWSRYNRPMVLARNAVDFEFYDEHYGPNTKLSGLEHPIVGYYGAIAEWFDMELLAHVACERPDYHFVLLGGTFNVDVSALKSLPNVSFLGQQPYVTMPQYLYHFDACIIPFKLNRITEATDPVKLYEYLSAGKPVVSVALPELEYFKDLVYIASDKDEFVAQLDRAVVEEDLELVAARRELARQNTWRGRYKLIEAGLRDTAPRASIIVVTYDNLALNKLCLESIIRNTDYPNYEVVVVDNKSTDGTQAYLRYMAAQYSNIQIILNRENFGFARANNQGIARGAGDYIVLLNNDTVVPPGWLTRLLRHLRDPAIGMVGPVTNFVGNEAKILVPYETLGEMELFSTERAWAHAGEVADISMLAMFCVAFRRNIYELVGALDEQFGIGMFEDDDYARRVKEKGYRVICAADVFVHHFGQAAFKKLIERGEYDKLFDANRRLYENKWGVKWVQEHATLRFEAFRDAS